VGPAQVRQFGAKPVRGAEFEELEQEAGGFGQQFTTYEAGIGRRFESLAAQIESMNRLMAGVYSHIRCMTWIMIAAALAALVGAIARYAGWVGFTLTNAGPLK
jgi:hypothetical protein